MNKNIFMLAASLVLVACGSDASASEPITSSLIPSSVVSSTVTSSTSPSTEESSTVVVSSEEVSSSSELILPVLTISFETNGGDLIESVQLTSLEGYTLPNAVRSGYTFLGWYIDEALTTLLDLSAFEFPLEDTAVVLYAGWELITFTVSFVDSLGTSYESITGAPGTPIQFPGATQDHYTFKGWFEDDAYSIPVTLDTIPSENVTLYGLWEANNYTISYQIKDPIVKLSSASANGALTASGDLYVYGYNGSGMLGIEYVGNNLYVPTLANDKMNLSEGEVVIDVLFTDANQLVLTSEHRVLIAGTNSNRQLLTEGINYTALYLDITDKIPGTVTSLLGYFHTVGVMTSTSDVYLWGYNDQEQFGVPYPEGQNYFSEPVHINPLLTLNEGETIEDIVIGKHSVNVLTSLNRLFGAGVNNEKQAGVEANTYIARFTEINSAFALAQSELIIRIAYGSMQGYAFTSQGRFFSWGANWAGQLGKGSSGYSIPLDTSAQFNLTEGETIVDMAGGDEHGIALSSNQRLFAFGSNGSGQIGDNGNTNQLAPVDITSQLSLLEGEQLVDVFTGYYSSFVTTSYGRLLVWGNNQASLYSAVTIDNYRVPTPMFNAFQKVYTPEVYAYQSELDLLLPATPQGYQFDQWYTDEALTTPFTDTVMPGGNLTLYSAFIPTIN